MENDEIRRIREDMRREDAEIREALISWLVAGACIVVGLMVAVDVFAQQVINVRVTAARGPNALPAAQVRRMVQSAIDKVNQACWINAKIKKFEVIRNPFQHLHKSLNRRVELLYAWENYFHRRGSRADVKLAVIPPFQSDGRWWLAGYSTGACDRGGVAYASGEPKNSSGLHRLLHSQAAIEHEIYHVLGASDRANSGIMDTGVLYNIGMSIPPLSDYSQWEIVKCVSGWGK